MSKAVPQTTVIKRVELERLRERVGRFLLVLQEVAEEVGVPLPGAWSPPVDLCETEDAVVAHVELPGVSVESLEVALTSGQLRISGKKRKGAPRGRIAHLCSERNYGLFSRVISLRWPVRVHDATAELRQGVLTVRLPKIKDRRGSEFKITVTSDE
jgi:HSP20 family protein